MTDEMRTRAASTLLWVLVALAATGGASSWFRSSDSTPPVISQQAESVGPSWAAVGFGQRFVATYLAARPETESSLAAFLGFWVPGAGTQQGNAPPGWC
jgi:hypothetical protein